MTILEKILIFYAVAGVITGALISTMGKVTFTWRAGSRPARYPRIAIFLACLILWPVFFWQIISGR